MLANMSLVQYSSAFSFLGFYIADPAIRGQGIGLEGSSTSRITAGNPVLPWPIAIFAMAAYQQACPPIRTG